ncbi:hypothetical protein G9A89_008475 [Geosiphon pyriformis]|nr:hypothetical protein G9A89_008475 [Geosiphon pyriformis]
MSNYIVKTHIYATKTICFELYLLAYITCSLQGTLNALVFSQDIAVSRASQSLRRYWWKIYVNPFENRYPNLSRNKSFPSQKGTSTDDQYCALNYSSAIEIDSADDIAIKLDVITSHINSFSTANYHPDTSKVFPYPPYWERFRYLLLVSLLNRPSVQDEVALEQVESRSRLSLYSTNVERRQCHVSSTKLASLSTLNQVNSSELSESNSISSEDRLKTILAKVNAAKLARSHSVLIPDNLNWESNNGNVSKLDSNILAIPDPVIENSNSAHLAIVELVNLPSINQAESLILESATPTLENNNDNNNHDIIPGFEQSLNVSFHSNLSDNEYQDTLRKL